MSTSIGLDTGAHAYDIQGARSGPAAAAAIRRISTPYPSLWIWDSGCDPTGAQFFGNSRYLTLGRRYP
jgi:hypothetical protein